MVLISKIYKLKDKLVVNIPFDVVDRLGLKDGDEVDFFQYSDRYYIVAKKSDILGLITQGGITYMPQVQQRAGQAGAGLSLADDELAVLRKLDTIRYGERTKDRLRRELNDGEKKTLQRLINKKFVVPFKKGADQQFKYSIAKNVYDRFLFGKRGSAGRQAGEQPAQTQQQPKSAGAAKAAEAQPQPKKWEQMLGNENTYLDLLESNGFLVVANQAEASSLSSSLEESIRRGLVVGIRAFNKKYYIMLKSFMGKNAQKIVKAMGQKGTTVEEIAKETGIEEEGVRAVLYIMAESGDVTEVKRDTFRLV